MRLATALALLLVASAAPATTIHVPGDQPTIQAGIGAAAAGDTVLVAAGTYSDCTHDDGSGTLNCAIIDAPITLRSESGPSLTTIDAESQGRVILCRDGGTDTTIEGFTITGGTADFGGGIYLNHFGRDDAQDASPRILDAVITQNSAINGAGVLDARFAQTEPLLIERTTISGNEANDGAAVYLVQAAARIFDSRITENVATDSHAAAIASWEVWSPDVELHNTLVANNACSGIRLRNLHCDSGLLISSCTLYGNVGTQVLMINSGGVTVDRSIIVGWVDCFIDDDLCGSYTPARYSYTDLWGGGSGCASTWEQPNLNADPLFCGPDDGNLFLSSSSPCLPPNNPWGVLIGAYGVGCGATGIEPETWAGIKARYRSSQLGGGP